MILDIVMIIIDSHQFEPTSPFSVEIKASRPAKARTGRSFRLGKLVEELRTNKKRTKKQGTHARERLFFCCLGCEQFLPKMVGCLRFLSSFVLLGERFLENLLFFFQDNS